MCEVHNIDNSFIIIRFKWLAYKAKISYVPAGIPLHSSLITNELAFDYTTSEWELTVYKLYPRSLVCYPCVNTQLFY